MKIHCFYCDAGLFNGNHPNPNAETLPIVTYVCDECKSYRQYKFKITVPYHPPKAFAPMPMIIQPDTMSD